MFCISGLRPGRLHFEEWMTWINKLRCIFAAFAPRIPESRPFRPQGDITLYQLPMFSTNTELSSHISKRSRHAMDGLSPYEVLVNEFLDKCPLPCGIGDSRSHLTMACPAASWAKTVPTTPIWKTNLSSANSSQTQPSMAPAPKWLCLTWGFLHPCAGLERSQYNNQSERKTDAGKKKS